MQAETARSELQVLLNQQQVTGQLVQCLYHQQGTTHTLSFTGAHVDTVQTAHSAENLTRRREHVWNTSFDIPLSVFSRIQTDSCRM